MGVTLICPNLGCGRTIVVPETTRGQVVRCAHCNQPFLVPLSQVLTEAAGTPREEPGERGESGKRR